ncbi:undecaprenyl diphosphate synthase [Humitalea rosea]|uniref:Isoprenyl transferase n=1 Tax=Humitalea rosea TaxID=990373 RepID=A0A2W7IY45_9PROT|nr:polyprenyl diphosphate synthase [Humitalea rosea]PZW43583.1 undecaprenyl diphosphate synthase [Humitalea rosea]
MAAPDTSAALEPATQAPALLPASAGGGVPVHVGIIMDGNRRWAQARGLPRALGHKAGAEAARRTIEAAADSGIRWLTLFAFSSENWNRPEEEVRDLTGLLGLYLRHEVGQLVKNGVRLRVIGDRKRFGPDIAEAIITAETRTAGGTRLNLNVALSYGARAEIVAATRAIAADVAAGTLRLEDVTEALVSSRLSTAGMPDPDLVIRASGEQRLSNFLLWQAAYAEFTFPDVLWPDFGAEHLRAALAEYAGRERRFGLRSG